MKRVTVLIMPIFICALVLGGVWYTFSNNNLSEEYKTPEEADSLVRFTMEVYDIIQNNFWQKATDADLSELFRLSLMKAANTAHEVLSSNDRAGVATMLSKTYLRTVDYKTRRDLAVATVQVVLFNLSPQGRSGLLSQIQERELRDTVGNIDRSKDLYDSLGIAKGSDLDTVEKAYQEKKDELEQATTTEAKEALAQLEYSHQVLSNEKTKTLYDETKMEPTVSVKTVAPHTIYIDMNKVSPASFGEFAQVLDDIGKNPNLDLMIIDFRGNIGGSLDFVQYFMAIFFGPNQYVFDVFHQDEYRAQRTPNIAPLDSVKRIKEIAILTDEMTQSTAELTAVIFQRFNLGVVVGKRTRGWGTIENTHPITTEIDEHQKYSVLLVNGLTLRSDNQPIEGRGVDPDIDVTLPDWKQRLSQEFQSRELLQAIIDQY